jgi:hypothetical protein
MSVYYIVTNNGFLKRYYSEHGTSVEINTETGAKFTAALRNAKGFDSIAEAKNIIAEKAITGCLVINQFGIKQI